MKNPKKLITKGIHTKKLTSKKMVIPRGLETPSMNASYYSNKIASTIPSYSFSSN